MREHEPLCDVTWLPCRWVCEEQFDDAGELVTWDAFCQDCMRWRDWSKDEAEPPAIEFFRPICRRYFLGVRPLLPDPLEVIFRSAAGGGKWHSEYGGNPITSADLARMKAFMYGDWPIAGASPAILHDDLIESIWLSNDVALKGRL